MDHPCVVTAFALANTTVSRPIVAVLLPPEKLVEKCEVSRKRGDWKRVEVESGEEERVNGPMLERVKG